MMEEFKDQKKKEFAGLLGGLRDELKQFYKEQVELEQAMASTGGAAASSGNPSSNVWNVSTRMKSIQVVQSMIIIEKKLGFTIPEGEMGNLVKQGGYANFQEMENDLFPKLEKVYIAGGFPDKKKEKAAAK